MNQVCAFCHPHKAFQIWSTVSRCGKKHGYQIFHRDLLKPNSKYFQRFHLLRLAQLLPVIRLSRRRPRRMTEQSLAGGTRGQTGDNPHSAVPGHCCELQRSHESRDPVPPELERNSGLPNFILRVLLASLQHSFALPLASMHVEGWTTSTRR